MDRYTKSLVGCCMEHRQRYKTPSRNLGAAWSIAPKLKLWAKFTKPAKPGWGTGRWCSMSDPGKATSKSGLGSSV